MDVTHKFKKQHVSIKVNKGIKHELKVYGLSVTDVKHLLFHAQNYSCKSVSN